MSSLLCSSQGESLAAAAAAALRFAARRNNLEEVQRLYEYHGSNIPVVNVNSSFTLGSPSQREEVSLFHY
jgi:hypothetical protein